MRLGNMGLTLRGGSFIGDAGLDDRTMAIAWMEAQAFGAAFTGVLTWTRSRERDQHKATSFGLKI